MHGRTRMKPALAADRPLQVMMMARPRLRRICHGHRDPNGAHPVRQSGVFDPQADQPVGECNQAVDQSVAEAKIPAIGGQIRWTIGGGATTAGKIVATTPGVADGRKFMLAGRKY